MDAYSMSATSAFLEKSRIYQDLRTSRRHSTIEPADFPVARKSSIMDQVLKGETLDPSRKPHVGVIGAGLAGLRSADVLLRHGFRVTILEARNRLGGRLYQERLPNGHLVDIGANWVHGTQDNPIMDLARETNTPVHSFDSPAVIFDENGLALSMEDSIMLSEMTWDIIKDAFRFANEHGSEIDPSRSLLDFFKEQIPTRIPESDQDYAKKRHMALQLCESWGAFVGSPIEKQSLRFFWLEECLDGENLFCAGTYHKVLEKIAQPAMAGADIRYQTQVSEIYGKSTSTGNTARVKTIDGQVMEFDELVVTTPLGWLKQNLQAFHPPLPETVSRGIQNIGYGCLEKVYISFPRAFWLKPDKSGVEAKGFGQWLSPNYAPESNPRRWNNEVVELASLEPPSGHPTLLFYIFGDESHHVTSKVRSLGNKGEREDFLFSFFEPYYSRLPSYDKSDPNCKPTACFWTDWLHDDLAGNGSYCNFQVGLEEGDKDILAMREGVKSEGLWLAGEHTAPFVALGTVTGAYWSGEDVAKRIAREYGRIKPEAI